MKTTFVSAFVAALLPAGSLAAAPNEPTRWAGVVVDDEAAEYAGKWVKKAKQSCLFGKTYHHDDKKDPSAKSARFTSDLPEAGQYEVRLLWVPDANRATNVSVSVFSDEGETKCAVNEREAPLISGVPRALGVFRFVAGRNGAVVVSTVGADGFVVVDAVQFVPIAIARAERAVVKDLLAEPRQVRHTASSPAHLRVEWDDVATDETGYRIWRREAGGAWYLAGETGANATHFDDGGMQELTAYEHKVAAFNSSGEGAAAVASCATKTPRMEPHLKPEVIVSAGRTFPSGPAAVALKSGELLLAYQTGYAGQRRNHMQASAWMMNSRDGFRGWSEPLLILTGGREVIYGKCALVRLSDGRLGMSFSRWMCDEKGKIIGRQRQFIASADEGESWSAPVDVGPMSANNQTLIIADSGRLLESLSGTTGVNEIHASDDLGGTWRSLGTVPGKGLGEAALAHVGGGRLVFLSRHEWPFYRLSFSADNGGTWEKTESLLYLGGGDNPPKLTLLPDGKTLAAIVHSWYPGRKAKDRRQLASVISRDGGRTWDNFRLIGFAPDGADGFLQHSITFVGDTGYLFYGGGSRLDTNDGKDLRVLRLHKDFFTSTTPWPYDWHGRALAPAQK
ncbi:MAG: exo-alpha-sialidase [Chthoniobacteraceae bacterium]